MATSNDPQRARASTLTRLGRFFTGSPVNLEKNQSESSTPSSHESSRSNSVRRRPGEELHTTKSHISLNSHDSVLLLNSKLNHLQVNNTNPYQLERSHHEQQQAASVGSASIHTPSAQTVSPSGAGGVPQPPPAAIAPSAAAFTRNSSIRKPQIQPRFKIVGDGGVHEHYLKVIKRQEKLGQMVKDWLVGSTKKRSEAVSAVPNLFSNDIAGSNEMSAVLNGNSGANLPPTLFATYMQERDQGNVKIDGLKSLQQVTPIKTTDNNEIVPKHVENFEDKYGKCQEVIGKGTFGIVRVAHKKVKDKEVLYAVKEFTRKQNESDKKYSNRLTNEFCISSSLKHSNIINAFDLFKDSKGDYCEVMEYCQGGDLYSLIMTAGKLEYAEADCFFKQLLRAVHYMHSMGVSHRDLKPENILLTHDGTLKITDFGNAECFKMAWEEEIQFSNGISGSSPYIAPEEYTKDEFDPRCVDVWSCGVIYIAMRTGRQLWQTARRGDEFFDEYLRKRKAAKGYEPIETLKRARCRNVIYSILDPIPERRITALQVLKSEWVREINCCKQ